MVTAQFPFDGQDDKAIMKNITAGKFTTESSLFGMQYQQSKEARTLKIY